MKKRSRKLKTQSVFCHQHHFILFTLIQFIFSCNHLQENTTVISAAEKQDSIPSHVPSLASLPDSLRPKTIFLDNVPKPIRIKVPKTKGGSYTIINTQGELEHILLEPPVTKVLAVVKNGKDETTAVPGEKPLISWAGGKSDFTNFNVDNGLAADEIFCSAVDKKGNIWFGSNGGGVSRFDGKSFTNFTTEEGLAHNMVWCIYEDKAGNLWFGTYGGGVSRYDGKSFITFTTAQGLLSNIVNSVIEDKSGNLWFGTWGGVSRFDGKCVNHPCYRNTCQHHLGIRKELVEHNKELAKCFTSITTAQGLTNNNIVKVLEDKSGNIWFGMNDGGVCRYDGKSFTNITTAQGLISNSISNMVEDKSGNIWFSTFDKGLSVYHSDRAIQPCNLNTCHHNLANHQELEEHNKEIARSFSQLTTEDGLINNGVKSIVEDKSGFIWLGTFDGVSRYDPSASIRLRSGRALMTSSKSFTNFTTTQGLASNQTSCIVEDKTGNIWIGTHTDGVSRYNGDGFTSITKAQGLDYNFVGGIIEDRSGNLWLGVFDGLFSGSVCRYDGKSLISFSTSQGLIGSGPFAIVEDKTGNLWFGTVGNGVSRYDGTSFTNFTTKQGLASNYISSIIEDKTGKLWFGTYGGGVSCYDGQSFTTYTNAQGLARDSVFSIAEDNSGNLWFGTSIGVSCFNGKSFTTYTKTEGLPGNRVLSILNDKAGNLWFGTADGGLSRLWRKNIGTLNKATFFENFSTSNGLATNRIFAIAEDKQGNIILGTNLGLSVIPSQATALPFSAVKSEIEYFNSNAYPIKQISVNALCADSKGILWAGTESQKTSLVRFDYGALHKNKQPIAVYIQNIKINEENICWYDLLAAKCDSMLLMQQEGYTYGKTLSGLDRDSIKKKFKGIIFDSISPYYPIPKNLVLPFDQNNVSFDFQAIETGRNVLVRYQYFLEGYSKDWSPETENTSAIFGNMAAGHYHFKLKAKSPEGIWSEPVSYAFTVMPPWWRTWWMYTVYFFVVTGSIWYYIKSRERALKENQNKLERIIVERTAEVVKQKDRAEQSEKFKQQFLANMSHEIRTPMNAVMGLTELVLDSPLSDKQRDYLQRVKRSSDNLLHIINDILDISKIEAGKIELENIDFSIRDMAEQVNDLLRAKANKKNIHLMTTIDPHVPEIVIGDPMRLTQVLMNLADNAIKFTDKGSVWIELIPVEEQKIRFSVIDTGIGIPAANLESIFESFTQAHSSDSRKYGGTGLGLAISKQFIEMMGGELKVESAMGSGTTFSFELTMPMGSKENELRHHHAEDIDGSVLNGLRILLVDDNVDNRMVAHDLLLSKSEVIIEEATNGLEAIEVLAKKDFDIVLMDVQMAVMDGYQATKEIRAPHSLARNPNIPIIALTASVIRSDLDKCRSAGMNDYVSKPFKTTALITTIANLLGREIKYGSHLSAGKVIDSMSVAKGTDMTYLHDFCEGDPVRMKKYISIFLESIPMTIKNVKEALALRNYAAIASELHACKTRLIMMGMDDAAYLAAEIEVNCRQSHVDPTIEKLVMDLIKRINDATAELQKKS